MKHHEIAGRMPTLKYEAGHAFDDVGAMVDELASCPPGHERAGQLAQQIKSHLDRVTTHIGDMQPDHDEPAPVEGKPTDQSKPIDEQQPAQAADDKTDEADADHTGPAKAYGYGGNPADQTNFAATGAASPAQADAGVVQPEPGATDRARR